jgi:membrane-associated phospholipid phosphatase
MMEAKGWRRPFTTPYPITWPMLALMVMPVAYLFIADHVKFGRLSAPALPIDAAIPLVPAWVLVYGALYLFLIILPVFVIRAEPQVRRTFLTYLVVWIVAFVVFVAYPTKAPRPADLTIAINTFADWGVVALYEMDPPLNCFPSLHVAHSFVSALAVRRVHRRLGDLSLLAASLVGISTLFTRQHYVLDVLVGAALAFGTYALLWRRFEGSVETDRKGAVAAALAAAGAVCVALICYYALYLAGVRF